MPYSNMSFVHPVSGKRVKRSVYHAHASTFMKYKVVGKNLLYRVRDAVDKDEISLRAINQILNSLPETASLSEVKEAFKSKLNAQWVLATDAQRETYEGLKVTMQKKALELHDKAIALREKQKQKQVKDALKVLAKHGVTELTSQTRNS